MPLTSPGQSTSSHACFQFLNSVLSRPNAVPYDEDLKWSIRQQLVNVVQHFPGLQARTNTYTHNDGRTVSLLQADGTIPMYYQDVKYNIPVTIWLLEAFPRQAPLVYVTPTRDMIIKPRHRHVDPSGLVSVAYLQQWVFPRSNLVELVQSLSLHFGQDPPLYTRPSGSSVQQQQQQQFQGMNPIYSTSSPQSSATTTSSSTSGANSALGPVYPPPYFQQQQQPQQQQPSSTTSASASYTEDPAEVFRRNARRLPVPSMGSLEEPLAELPAELDGLDVWAELKCQCLIAGPMVGVNLLQFLIQVTAVMFVGHLGELALSSASLATSSCVVTGFSLLLGMASALETLCGQAYGAGQYHLLGIYLQRAVVVLFLSSIPVAVVWFNMGTILRLLGQEADIAADAGEYARCLIPGLFAYASLQPLVKFLQTQSAVFPMLISSLVTLTMHIPLCWLFVYKLEFGGKGAALAASMSNWLNAAFLVLYVKLSPRCKRTWVGLSKEAFLDLGRFFHLAIPSALMICLEYWSFEALILLSGLLPRPQLVTSAFSVLLNSLSLCYMIPYGLSAAVSTRVSNELGAGHPLAAKKSVLVTLSIALVDSVLIVTLLLSTRHLLGWAFSSEAEVVDYVASLLPVTCLISAVDPIQSVLSGVARGCGWQAIGAFLNLGAYYIVGLPTAYVLGFVVDLQGKGLWIGIICGIMMQTLALALVTLQTDWQKQARAAWRRVLDSSEEVAKHVQ